jgi:hypothetical protein
VHWLVVYIVHVMKRRMECFVAEKWVYWEGLACDQSLFIIIVSRMNFFASGLVILYIELFEIDIQ